MKITDVRTVPVWSGTRNFLFVVVETDDGIIGVGEAGLTGREHAVIGAIEHFRPLLVGADPFRSGHLGQVLARGGFFPAQRVLSSAIAAVDIALWDVKGKAMGRPLHELFGGRVRDVVPVYGHVNPNLDGGWDAVAEAAVGLRDAGWGALRFGIPAAGGSFDPRVAVREAVELFAKVRAAVGEETELIVDAHTRLDLPEATWLCRELEPLHPLFVEDPLRCENLEAYRRLRERTGVPLAAGEQLSSKWEFRPLVEEELIDYARVDLCIAAGFTEAAKIAAMCETHHVRVAVHNPLGPVSTAAATQFNTACVPFGIQEDPLGVHAVLPDVVSGGPQWSAGARIPTDVPGLGVELDEVAAEAYPPRWVEPPHLSRADGSFTNW